MKGGILNTQTYLFVSNDKDRLQAVKQTTRAANWETKCVFIVCSLCVYCVSFGAQLWLRSVKRK